MTTPDQSERSIFLGALELTTAPERMAFLDEACGDDTRLREGVEALMRAHDRPQPLLDAPDAHPSAPDGPAGQVGEVIGSYKLLERIGEGGMGEVWVADQTEPIRRRVALKLVKPGMDSRTVLARFEAERQALALMDHPNIAKVLDAGATPAGRPYFVMELVKGVPVTKYCDDMRLTPRQRLELFADVCGAVQHAHQKGVIHRDLKPSNVLVAPYDETPVVKVIDFGVAKAAGQPLTDKTLYTGFGAVVGTPEYMSPEQAELNNADVDTRSDIYSLGVLLFELLTGTTPLERGRVKETGLLEALRIVREEEAPTLSNRLGTTAELPAIAAARGLEPTRLRKLVRGELDWIVRKALEKDRSRRYQTANGLAADVQRYLADEPVQACPPSTGYRLSKFARRHRAGLATAIAFAGLLVIGAAVSTWLAVWARQAEEAERAAKRQAQAAAAAEQQARQDETTQRMHAEALLAARLVTLARLEWSGNNLDRANEYLSEVPATLRDRQWRRLHRMCNAQLHNWQDPDGVADVVFHPDGRLVATAGTGGVVKLRDAATGQTVLNLQDVPRLGNVRLAFSRDGSRLTAFRPGWGIRDSRAFPGAVYVWDTASGAKLAQRDRAESSFGLLLVGPEGCYLMSKEPEGVGLREAISGRLIRTFPAKGEVLNTALSRDGQRLAGVGMNGLLHVWDVATGELTCSIPAFSHDSPMTPLEFSPDGKRLASTSAAPQGTQEAREVRVWDLAAGKAIVTFRAHTDIVHQVAFSPDGRHLATASRDRTLNLWDAATGETLLTFRGHTRAVGRLAFSPDGQRLASIGSDRTVRIWDARPVVE